MNFVSISFVLYFLAPLLVIYYLVPKKVKNAVLFLASLIFCAVAGPVYFLVPLVSIALNYIMGRIIGRHRKVPLLMLAAVINTVIPLAFGLMLKPEMLFNQSSVLILFFGTCMCSLRALSYLKELYSGTTAIQKNPLKFGLYMLYFPTFAAGPLISYNDFRLKMSQRKHSGHEFLCGTAYFVCGVLKKIILADRLGVLWNTIRVSDYNVLTSANAWFGFIALILYIILSVSSYLDCAVGICRMTGFEVSRVFRPINRIKKSGVFSIVAIVPAAAAVFCIVRLHDANAAAAYIDALMLKKNSGMYNIDFMYRLNSSKILLIVSVITALHIPFLAAKLVSYLLPKKENKDNVLKNGAAIAIMGIMLAATAVNTLYSILHEENVPEAESGSYVGRLESYIDESSLFRKEIDKLNLDAGYLMKISGTNGVYYAKGNTLIECPPEYNELNVDRGIEKLDAVSDDERYTMHLALISPAYEIYADRLPEFTHDGRVKKVRNRVCTLLNGSPIRLFDAADALVTANVDDVYYSTSPALNVYGVYAVYQALAPQLDYEAFDYGDFGFKDTEYSYEGTLMHRAGNHFTRKDIYSEPERGDTETDTDVTVSRSDARSGRALAVIADDSAPNIDALFAKNFDTVYMIDINDDTEDIIRYMSDKFITDVLAVCSTDYLAKGKD